MAENIGAGLDILLVEDDTDFAPSATENLTNMVMGVLLTKKNQQVNELLNKRKA